MPPLNVKSYGVMIAVDTDVLVRLLTGDDPKQAAAAQSLFAAGPVWIAKTVIAGNRLGAAELIWI